MSSEEPLPPPPPPQPLSTEQPVPPPLYGALPPYPYPPRRGMAAGGDIALKILIGSAVGLVLGFGTCGMGAILSGKSETSSKLFIGLGLFLFAASVLGLIVSAIWLLVAAIIGATQR